ncbi:GGDEF domain-containing protein [Xanthobacter sp. V4C-4]|uniref:GGDEF domain-containing protein n=1 Tax=Xanthobacter cornucopiae TaxID=3119924 RepID=UPI00372AF123
MFIFDYFAPLDLRTLFRLIFITDLVVCLMLLAYGERGPKRGLILRFVAARSLHAVGCLLIGSRGEISAWLSISLANALVYFGFALELTTIVGLRARRGVPAPVFFITAAAGSLAILVLDLSAAAPGNLVGVSGLTVAALFAPAALLLARSRRRSSLQRTLAAFYVLVALSFLMRAYAGFIEGRSVLDRNMFQLFGLIVMYCYAVAGGVGFLLLLKEDDDQRLRHAAETDPLTGILNHRAFFDAARGVLAVAAQAHRPLALLLVDVDHFKRVNDTYGHPVGDRVLQALVRAIAERTRATDIFGRVGGEEFALLLPDARDKAHTLDSAERVRLAVNELDIPEAPGLRCSISIGCALAVPRSGDDIVPLMRSCDNALYAAKSAGRNRAALATNPLPEETDAVA